MQHDEHLQTGSPERLRALALVFVAASRAASPLALRGKDAQGFIATFGVGKYEDLPLFYPVTIEP